MSYSQSPSLLNEYSARRIRRNPSTLAYSPQSRNTLTRVLKHKTFKEELHAFYERQSEGLPAIPNYLTNTVYAELIKQQWLIYAEIRDPNKLVSVESRNGSPALALPRLRRSNATLDFSEPLASQEHDGESSHVGRIIDSKINDVNSTAVNESNKKTPSVKEFEDLQSLLTEDSFKLSLVMQDLRLPSAWDQKAKGQHIDISSDKMQLTYIGDEKDDTDVASVRANFAMRKQCGIYYFEIKIISKGVDGHIGIGFCRRINSLDRFPGWEEHSWGYHGENGHVFSGPSTEKAYGPKYGTGDIIGCGIDFRDMSAFYTKNGVYLGSAFKKVKDTELFPFVGFKTAGEKIEANFGAKPFKFDIDQMLASEKRGLLGRIALKPALTSSKFKIVNNSLENNLADNVVMEYLKHNGYHGAAKSLQESILLKESASSVENSESRFDTETTHRQDIRKAVFDGNIDHVFKLCDEHYPNVLQDNPMILFKLKCRKFIEMIKQAHKPQDAVKDQDTLLHEAQSLKVSENTLSHSISVKRTASLSDSSDLHRKNKKQKIGTAEDLSLLVDGLAYGMELKKAYARESKTNKAIEKELESASSILAYKDLTDPKVAPLFEARRIEIVASELNSAILVSLGKYPNSSLERIYRQTSAVIEELVLSGNAKAALLQPKRDCFNFLNV